MEKRGDKFFFGCQLDLFFLSGNFRPLTFWRFYFYFPFCIYKNGKGDFFIEDFGRDHFYLPSKK